MYEEAKGIFDEGRKIAFMNFDVLYKYLNSLPEEDLKMYKDIAASQAKRAVDLEKELAQVKQKLNDKTNA